jgi:Uma2 family endonuclease
MSTDLQITTADELLKMPAGGFRYELVRGVLKCMSPAGAEHGEIGSLLLSHLTTHIRMHRLGSTYMSNTGFKISSDPDTVLAPDVSFVAQDRAQTIRDRRKFVPFAPDLAIEVLSPSDTYSEALEKIEEWLTAGTRAVVFVDPRNQTVTVYRSATEPVVLSDKDNLEVPDVVPGWSIPLPDIFEAS